jgi:ribonuclease VapC
MNDVVLDASAIIAVINREPGAERVVPVADGAVVSSLIVAEVVTWLALRNIPEREIVATIDELNFRIEAFDQSRAMTAGLLVSKTKRRGLSLADRACLALAIELGLPAMTANRAWRNLDIGVEIRLVR